VHGSQWYFDAFVWTVIGPLRPKPLEKKNLLDEVGWRSVRSTPTQDELLLNNRPRHRGPIKMDLDALQPGNHLRPDLFHRNIPKCLPLVSYFSDGTFSLLRASEQTYQSNRDILKRIRTLKRLPVPHNAPERHPACFLSLDAQQSHEPSR
jgi:hypothetical protein